MYSVNWEDLKNGKPVPPIYPNGYQPTQEIKSKPPKVKSAETQPTPCERYGHNYTESSKGTFIDKNYNTYQTLYCTRCGVTKYIKIG